MGLSDDDVEIGSNGNAETVPLVPSAGKDGPLAKRSTIRSPMNVSINNNITTQEERKDRRVKRLRKKKTSAADHAPIVKYGSLVLLVAQLVGLVMLMRYSRTHSNGTDLYLSSTAVFCMEVREFSVVF